MNIAHFNQNTENYIHEIQDKLSDSPNDISLLTTLAQVYMETRKFELAQPLLERAIKLDPDCKEGKLKAQRYFWLGTIISGLIGVSLHQKGYIVAQNRLTNIDRTRKPKKYMKAVMQLSQAYLSECDIWMSELQNDSHADAECERLIGLACGLTKQNPDAWIMQATLRIRQKRYPEARESIYTCWKLHQEALKDDIIDRLGLFKLLQLAECMVKTDLYELVLDVTQLICYLNDQIPMAYYLTAYAHRKLLSREMCIPQTGGDAENRAKFCSKHIIRGREAAEVILEASGTIDPDLKVATRELYDSFPQPEIEDPFDIDDEEKQSGQESDDANDDDIDSFEHLRFVSRLPSESEEESDEELNT